MKKKIPTELMLTLLLVGTLTVAFNIQLIGANGTIYIRADGSIDPPTANIMSVNNVTYTFTDDNYDEIVIQRDDIIVDGKGHTLECKYPQLDTTGILLTSISNVTVENIIVRNFYYAIYLFECSRNNIFRNNLTFNIGYAIYLNWSSDNWISGNNLFNNGYYGIYLDQSSNNSISGNCISSHAIGLFSNGSYNSRITGNKVTNCGSYGIHLEQSFNSSISENVLGNNGRGVYLERSSNNYISKNEICNNGYGMDVFWHSSNNTISGNSITNNIRGIVLDATYANCYNNTIYHNTFTNNTNQVELPDNSVNVWDNGYPSGGNYWNDYNGSDLDGDGIGDTPYFINDNNLDHYPLMMPWASELLKTDLNQDGTVNILDISIVAIAFGTTEGDPNYNPIADLDENDEVNILDVSIVAMDYGKTM